jgi:pimeloyl-ACP methyl ester carboxylesterase
MKSTLLAIALFLSIASIAQTPIDTMKMIDIGGIKQFISIKGNDTSKPILLFLHGGPGNSARGYYEKFTNKLQKNFLVVMWDQRQTGMTLLKNSSPLPLQLAQFENDTHEVIVHLLKEFNRDKLYLMGHSWGTYLGFHVAKNFPDLLYAYLPVAPMINQLESERIILDLMIAKAIQTGDSTTTRALKKISVPFKNSEQVYIHRKNVHRYSKSKSKFTQKTVDTWASTWLDVFNEASANNLLESTPVLLCPVYFFVGRKDYQTNSTITEQYYQILSAPKKNLFWFERSGHFIPTTEPELLQDIIIEKVLPETSSLIK